MLAERVAKVHAQLGRGVMTTRSRRAMAESAADFEKGLRDVTAAAGSAEQRENYRLLRLLWDEYRVVAAQAPTPESARKLGERAEEVAAGQQPEHPPVVDDGHDEHAVVEEDLGDLQIGEVGADLDVLGVHVLPDRLGAAARAPLERLVERALDEGDVAQLLEIAREQRLHELAFAEDPGVALARVDDRKRGRFAVEHSADRNLDRVVHVQRRRRAQDGLGEAAGAHVKRSRTYTVASIREAIVTGMP